MKEKLREAFNAGKDGSLTFEAWYKEMNGDIPSDIEVIEYMKQMLPRVNSEWTPRRIEKAASLKYQTCVDNGWCDGNNNPIKNWKTKFLNMIKFERPKSYSDDKHVEVNNLGERW